LLTLDHCQTKKISGDKSEWLLTEKRYYPTTLYGVGLYNLTNGFRTSMQSLESVVLSPFVYELHELREQGLPVFIVYPSGIDDLWN